MDSMSLLLIVARLCFMVIFLSVAGWRATGFGGARRWAPWLAVVLVMAASCASAGPLGIRWLYRFALRGFHVGRRGGGAILRVWGGGTNCRRGS